MHKNFKYDFDEITGILYKYYYGNINIEDITSSWEYAFNNKLIPNYVKGFILDYRNANFNLTIDEHLEIPKFYKNNLEVFGGKKIAILIENPKDTVVPMMVKTKDDGYISQPFSTLEAAMRWVLQ